MASPDDTGPAPTQPPEGRRLSAVERDDIKSQIAALSARLEADSPKHPFRVAPYRDLTNIDLVEPTEDRLIVAWDVDDTLVDFRGELRRTLFLINVGLETLFHAVNAPLRKWMTTQELQAKKMGREDLLEVAFHQIYQGAAYESMTYDQSSFVQSTAQLAAEFDEMAIGSDERTSEAARDLFLERVLPENIDYIYSKDPVWRTLIVDHDEQIAIVESQAHLVPDDMDHELFDLLFESHHDAIMSWAIDNVDFYANLAWKPGARTAMQETAELGVKVVFNTACTHVSGRVEEVAIGRMKNIRDNDIPFGGDITFVNKIAKHLHPYHVIVEDSASNARKALEHGRMAIMVSHAHNRNAKWTGTDGIERPMDGPVEQGGHPLFRRVESVADVPAAIVELRAIWAEMHGERFGCVNAPLVTNGVGYRDRLQANVNTTFQAVDAKTRRVGSDRKTWVEMVVALHESRKSDPEAPVIPTKKSVDVDLVAPLRLPSDFESTDQRGLEVPTL